MNKQELHDHLADKKNSEIGITEQVFIKIYGKDDTRKIQDVDCTRADILERVHGLTVTKQETNYIFTR